jgi:hypothetical protein
MIDLEPKEAETNRPAPRQIALQQLL